MADQGSALPEPVSPQDDEAIVRNETGQASVVSAVSAASAAPAVPAVPAVPVVPAADVRIPQNQYWDEKICIEVEPIANTTTTPSEKSAAVGGYPAPGQSIRRSATGSDSITSEPAPAYIRETAFRGESGLAREDIPLPVEENKILGLPKRKFKIVAAGVAILLVTILAIVLGVVFGGNRSADSSVSPLGLLDNTKLTAMNWTDGSGEDHLAVFYQHQSQSLMMTKKDSLSNTWQTVNLTASIMNATDSDGLDVMSGSPIAAVTNGFQCSLYYATSDNRVAEVFSTDPELKIWAPGVFASKIEAHIAPGSRIGAVRQLCENCTQSIFVTWQDEGGDIQLANFTENAWNQEEPIFKSAAPGTGMAISSFTDFRGTGPNGADSTALRAYVSGGSTLMELMNGPENNFAWSLGNFGNALTTGLSLNPSPDIASITYGANGWSNNLVTFLDPKGGIMSSIFRGASWSVQPATLNGLDKSVTSFSSIATTQAMDMYALSKGEIHRFQTNATNPFTWTWIGVIHA